MHRYRCGKCGQKITDRQEFCPYCQAHLVYSSHNDKGTVMTATFSFLLIIYLAFFFGLFYEKIIGFLGRVGLEN